MNQLIDFASQEVLIGQMSLPLNLASGSEVLLTSIFLNIANPNVKVELFSSVGWEAQLSLLPLVPEVIFRIRRGGFTPASTLIFQTTDSIFLGAGNLIPVLTSDLTMSFSRAASPDTPAIAGTYQQYFLTAELSGTGGATISGPVTLIGQIIG
ncbi:MULTISPECIES: hypothetical protein [Bacillales]|uniref:hypothetical protein n=1 Tax=Bacillales TaxID=1385 RepID=UPI0006A79AAE|nr:MULTISPECIES: hypothetical protein [Bacillales]OBZ09212.1 hypothetical protein A7975_24175 [Bacillus sp. FJAT-26390]